MLLGDVRAVVGGEVGKPGPPPVRSPDPVAGHEEEELEDLEQSLQALERLDRSSPDLWPDHSSIPGVNMFLPPTPQVSS